VSDSPASSALRSAIPTSCAPAAGRAIALVTQAGRLLRSRRRLRRPRPPLADLARSSLARALALAPRNGRDERSAEPGAFEKLRPRGSGAVGGLLTGTRQGPPRNIFQTRRGVTLTNCLWFFFLQAEFN
jgi:hypothetical protein